MKTLKMSLSNHHFSPAKYLSKKKLLLMLFIFPVTGVLLSFHVQSASEPSQVQQSADNGQVLKITANTSRALLRSLPENTVVDLSNGKQIKMRVIRKATALSLKLKQSHAAGLHPSFKLKFKPASQGIKVHSLSEIRSALELKESETIQLPSGRLLTVEMLKLIQPELERRLGKKLSDFSKRPLLSGKTIQVRRNGNKKYWENIFNKPDDTVLESPGGKRITVGDLKKYIFAENNSTALSTTGQGGGQ